jgi:hypothetical protein
MILPAILLTITFTLVVGTQWPNSKWLLLNYIHDTYYSLKTWRAHVYQLSMNHEKALVGDLGQAFSGKLSNRIGLMRVGG